MQTLTNAELAFLSVIGNTELTTRVLRIYAQKTYLFTPMFNPHLNVMWDAYVALLTKYKNQYGLSLSPDIIAAGLAEAVQADDRLPQELKQKCDTILQKLVAGDVPDLAHGSQLIRNLMALDANRRIASKLNENADLIALQQTLDASKRTMQMMDDQKEDAESVGSVFNPLRDIRKLARKSVRIPTGINWLDDISSGGGREGDMWLILGAPAGGKCLGKDTPVLMYDGHVKMVQDIKDGDQVMGPDSNPRNVRGVTRGRSKMYKIHMMRGDSFICNYCHILTLVVTSARGVTVNGHRYHQGDLVDVPVDEYVKMSHNQKHSLKAYRTGVDFPAIAEPPLDPYFVGLYLGDGSRYVCMLTTMDQEVISYCQEYIPTIGLECWLRPGNGKAIDVVFRRKNIKDKSAKSLIQGETLLNKEKRIFDRYKLASRQNRLRLLAGIIDADGYAHHGGYDVVLKGRNLAEDVAFVARSLGYAVTLRECSKCCTNTGAVGTYYRLNIGGDMSELPIRIPRRKSVRTDGHDARHVGFTVEELPEDDYFGFELDGDGRFLLGDFTVTHNTICAVQYACGQALIGNDTLWATYEQTIEGDIAERMIANITDTSLDKIRDVGFDNLPQEVQDSFWASVSGVDDRLTAMDMTSVQPDPQDPEDYGGAMSLWKQVKKLKAEGHAPKTLVLDWFGSMMSRIASNLGLQLEACYRFKAQEEILKLQKMAREEKMMIIVFHQLDAKTAGARPTYLADATHAQDMHNMQNFFDLVAILGVKDVNNICYFSNPKARKGGRIVRTLHMIGEKSRFVMEDGWLPNSDGNFYKPGSTGQGTDMRGTAERYSRELD